MHDAKVTKESGFLETLDTTTHIGDKGYIGPDLSQLRLGWCLWIVLVLVRAFWVCRVGH